MKNYNPVILSVLGVLLGICFVFNLYLIYFSAIVIFVVAIIKKSFKGNEVDFLVKLFLVSLFMRVAFVLILRPVIFLYGNGFDIFGDGMAYFCSGVTIAETVRGNPLDMNSQIILNRHLQEFIHPVRLTELNLNWLLPDWVGSFPPVNLYQVGGYVYFLSAFYYLFGNNPLHGIFINCLLGAASGLLVYYIVKKISDNIAVPKFAAIIVNFFPSLFLWSITNLKDTPIIFSNLMIIICLIKILKEKKYSFLFIIALSLIVLFFLRPSFILPIFFWFSVILLSIFFSWVWRKKSILVLFIILLTLFSFFPYSRMRIENIITKSIDKTHGIFTSCLKTHKANAMIKGNYYKILEEKYYYKQNNFNFEEISFSSILNASFFGLAHFIFEPLPFKIHNFSTLIAYPQTMLVYFLLLFFTFGVFIVMKRDFRIFLVLFLYLFIFSLTIALAEGNVGGLLRHRDIVTSVFIIFSSIGFLNLLRGRKYSA